MMLNTFRQKTERSDILRDIDCSARATILSRVFIHKMTVD